MYGLVILGIALGYLIICLVAVLLTIRFSRRFRWRTRLFLGFLMLLLFATPVAYYYLPAMIARPFYCELSGFWLYETPEQWKLENPGIAEMLTQDGEQVDTRTARIFHLNERFDWRITGHKITNRFYQETQTVVDRKTGKVMAKKVDFNARARPFFAEESCFKKEERDRWFVNGKIFIEYKRLFEDLGEKK